jgi:hypothetical protein
MLRENKDLIKIVLRFTYYHKSSQLLIINIPKMRRLTKINWSNHVIWRISGISTSTTQKNILIFLALSEYKNELELLIINKDYVNFWLRFHF